MRFIPKRAYFEPAAMEYPLGQRIYQKLIALGVEIKFTSSHNRIVGFPGKNINESFREAKQTLVVGIRKSLEFAGCKPSAHFQLPLNTSCPSMCEYCYLATTLGRKPYVRVYVNIDEILSAAREHIQKNSPEITIFEGAATSDPVPTEYITGILKKTIEFFGKEEFGRFRFVTKHIDIDNLLTAKHNGHTRFRFSLNAAKIIEKYEHLTPSLEERIAAAEKVAAAGYPLGFIIAPIFRFDGWQKEYEQLFLLLDKTLTSLSREDLTFELITHRFTKRAKANILEIFPESTLPMEEETRKFKFGQFGYGKYVYKPEEFAEMKDFLFNRLHEYFPQAKIKYFV